MKKFARLGWSLVFSGFIHTIFFGYNLLGENSSHVDGTMIDSFVLSQSGRMQLFLQRPHKPSSFFSDDLHPQTVEIAQPLIAPAEQVSGKPNLKKEKAALSQEGSIFFRPIRLDRQPVLKGTIEITIDDKSLGTTTAGEAVFHIFINDIGRVVAVNTEMNSLPEPIRFDAEQALRRASFIPGYQGEYTKPSQMRWELKIKRGEPDENQILILQLQNKSERQ